MLYNYTHCIAVVYFEQIERCANYRRAFARPCVFRGRARTGTRWRARKRGMDFTVKLVFVVSAVVRHTLHNNSSAFALVCIVLSDRHYYIYVLYESGPALLRYPWRKREPLFRPSCAHDKRFVLHVAYIYLRVINASYALRRPWVYRISTVYSLFFIV